MKYGCMLPAIVVCCLSFQPESFAKAYFAPKRQMIERAEAIAIVEIKEVVKTDAKGRIWTYRQKAVAKVTQTIKGELPENVDLYGGETFICAQCNFTEGKYLVFLRKDGDKWVGSNWHLSVRLIKGDTVEWYKDDTSIQLKDGIPLKDVIEEIEKILKEQDAKNDSS